MKALHLENVQEAGARLPSGGYICRIVGVADDPGKEYLKINYDIVDGIYAGYYQQLWQNRQFWGGTLVKSYKDKALPFFKAFLGVIKESNENFLYDGKIFANEQLLTGMYIGIVLAEEQYRDTKSGSIKTRLYDSSLQSVQSIRDGNYTIPELKLLAPSSVAPDPFAVPPTGSPSAPPAPGNPFQYQPDDDLPF